MRRLIFVLVVTLIGTTTASAEERSGQIVVTGVGHASAPADKALLAIEVSVDGRKSDVAMEQVTVSSETVMSVLRTYGVSDEDVATTRLTMGENWQYDDGVRVFKGFTARTKLTVDLRDLTRIGNLVSTLSKDGAISVDGPYFGIENRTALRDEARRNAVQDGLATAQLLAEAAGVTLGPPLLITDGTEPADQRRFNTDVQMEEPMVMEEPVMEDVGEISETGVEVLPGKIERTETIRLIFRIAP